MCLHVDDFLVIASSQDLLDDLHGILTRKYGTVTIKSGNLLEYLGMRIEVKSNGDIRISQPLYTQKIVNEFLCEEDLARAKRVSTPMSSIGLSQQEYDDDPIDQTLYLRIVGSINFLAQYTRPDLLYAMSIAAQHCSNPTKRDLRIVSRILLYIAATPDYGITFTSGPIKLYCYCDSAHNCYSDGKGHYGYSCSLGLQDGAFFAASKKMKLTTLSSTESEYVAMCEAVREVVWMRNLLQELGWEQELPTIVWQDNKSTMDMVLGNRNHQASKHVNPKYHFSQDQIEAGNIEVVHCPTKEHLADFLTKPLAKGPFQGMASETMNMGLYFVRDQKRIDY
jgi:hypothetical protein